METTLQDTVKTAWQKSKWIVKGCIIGGTGAGICIRIQLAAVTGLFAPAWQYWFVLNIGSGHVFLKKVTMVNQCI